MATRIFALATCLVALLVAGGWSAVQARIGAVRATYDSTQALAQALVAHASDAQALEAKLANSDVHVSVEDRPNGFVYDWDNGAAVARPLPPLPPGAPPPEPGQQPPPRQPQQRFGPQRPPRSFFENIAGSLTQRQPIRIPGDSLAVVLAPNVRMLGQFILVDLLVTLAGIALAIGAATWVVTGLARNERRRLEATLEERRAAAKEFQRFLADAGHELRTPLTIVSGYVEIIAQELERTERGKQILEGLAAETQRMRALVEKMLLLARLETPVSVPRLVDIGDVAKDVIAQMQARFPDREIVFVTSNKASIVIDQDDLYEALRNLVENALRYAPGSPVEIAITPGEKNAAVAVTDHGKGIPEDEHDKIFDRFYRGSAQSEAEGSGLGLSIVARVAARWNGIVKLQSKPGLTMFTLQFPLADEVA